VPAPAIDGVGVTPGKGDIEHAGMLLAGRARFGRKRRIGFRSCPSTRTGSESYPPIDSRTAI
jgi:hypothetical protein